MQKNQKKTYYNKNYNNTNTSKNYSADVSNKIQAENQNVNAPNYTNNGTQQAKNYGKILLFPGENYEFDEKLLHYNVFGFAKENLVSKKCAILTIDKSSKKPIEDSSEEIIKTIGKFYTPKVDDFVIGTIIQKNPEFYKVDIGTYTNALLNTKDFEGASKKTKPNLNLGDLVFARVLKVNKFDAPILSCISQYDVKNWASGESFFGQLKKGNLFNIPMQHVFSLINSENYALTRLNDIISFEIVIGHNGKMWINSENFNDIFVINKLIVKSITEKDKNEVEKLIHDTFIDRIK